MKQLLVAFLAKAQWVVLPLLALGLSERLARDAFPAASFGWYDRYSAPEPDDATRFLFVGTSLTAASVHEELFELALEQKGLEASARNLGRGAGIVPLHWMGLGTWAREHPGSLEGAQVLIELHHGLPFHYHPAELDARGNFFADPVFITPLFLAAARLGHLRMLWTRDIALEQRLDYSVRLLLRDLRVVSQQERIQSRFMGFLTSRVVAALESTGLPPEGAFERPEGPRLDLLERGGVESAAEFAAKAEKVIRGLEETARIGEPFPPWEDSTLRELVELLEAEGADVFFFEMPLHPAYREILARPDTEEPRRSLPAFFEARGVRFLDVAAPDDPVFPDLLHLSGSQAPQFTLNLAEAWWSRR